MKANELRIGNLVNTTDNKLTGVTDIIVDKDFKDSYFWCYGYNEDDVKPIPLTEKWLLKFGFKNRTTLFDSKIYFKGIYFVSIIEGGNIVFGFKDEANQVWKAWDETQGKEYREVMGKPANKPTWKEVREFWKDLSPLEQELGKKKKVPAWLLK